MTVDEKRLEIKSHSDDLLKEVSQFLKNRPDYSVKTTISEVEKNLRAEAEFLKRVLRKNPID